MTAALDEAARRRSEDQAVDRRPRYSPAPVVADLRAAMVPAGVVVNPTTAQRDLR